MLHATRESLIKDIQRLQQLSPDTIVTRDYYRAHGKFSEAQWSREFPTFSAFIAAAGITKPEPEVNTISGNTWTIALPKTRIHTLEELVEYCEIDLSIWEVERFIANKWEVAAKTRVGNIEDLVVEPLFQIKAFLKKKANVAAVLQELEELKELGRSGSAQSAPKSRPEPTGNMLEVNIPDVHIGKLAWGEETGYGNYDATIGVATYDRAVDTLIQRTNGYKFDQIVFVVGNDMLNSDDIEGRTTKGTNVTTDGRYHKTFRKVRTMIIGAIEKLRTIAPVKVVMVPGNHDTLSVWHLGDSLECYFHKTPDVEIDNSPKYRKYHQYGSVMLMFTHGDKAKRQDYPLLMATEQPEMFGATKFREAHTGHNHMTKLDEQHGVRVRVLPALCQPDDWHAENGFVGNLRNAEAYIWNQKEGLIGMAIYSDDAMEPIVTTRQLVKGKR